MLECDDGPVDETVELCDNRLYPELEQRVLARDTVSRGAGNINLAQVGLVEHVRVMTETDEVAGGHILFECEKVAERTGVARGLVPFVGGAGWQITVEIDGSGPSWDNLEAGVAIVGDSGGQSPVDVLGIHEDRSAIVTDNVLDTIGEESVDGIAVVETSNGWRDETIGREGISSIDSNQLQPFLVPRDFLVDIGVGGVVQILMGEGVAEMTERIQVGRLLEPGEKGIKLGAGRRPVESGGSCRPQVFAGAEGLLELEIGRDIVLVVVDGRFGRADIMGVTESGILNVAIAVVAQLDEVRGAGIHLAVDGRGPRDVLREIAGPETELLASGRVQVGDQMDIVNLSAEVGTAETSVEATSDKVDPSVHEYVGGGAPAGSEADEEDNLLASTRTVGENVDDSSSGVRSVGASRTELGNLVSRASIDDGSRVVPEILGRDSGASNVTSRGEGGGVGEGPELLNAIVAAAGTVGLDAKGGVWVDVETSHANTEGGLVVVELLPLGVGQGAAVVAVGVRVGDLGEDNDTTVVTSAIAGQGGQGGAGGRHGEDLVGNTVSDQTRVDV